MRNAIALIQRVPLLPLTVLCAIPLAVLSDVHLWQPWFGVVNPSLGQVFVIALVAYTVVDALAGMIRDLRSGRVGVDVLAVLAILSTLAVQEYWASWAVVLMVWSGEAIEEYAQAKAESSLSALASAAPRNAHVVDLPGIGVRSDADKAGNGRAAFRAVAGAGAGVADAPVEKADAEPESEASSHFHTLPVEEVRLGDALVVLPGETVPVDGELLSASATLDLSTINGEPVPREMYAGARVMSGAVNGSNTLTMRTTQLAQDSQYQRILDLVTSAKESRAAVVRTADRLAVPFTVLALLIAGVAWLVSGDATRFAQVLVLATPCPLLIAAPVAYMAGTGRLAKSGILIKTQDVLENLGQVSHVFFDKTGTLTVKTPQVARVDLVGGFGGGQVGSAGIGSDGSNYNDYGDFDQDHILALAGAIETYSVHILAQGIAAAGEQARHRLAEQTGGQYDSPRGYPVVSHVSEDAGNGVCGEVDGVPVRVGRFDYVIATQDSAQDGGADNVSSPAAAFPVTRFGQRAPDEMVTYVAVNGRLAARIVLKDVPRANAREALDQLRSLGVERLTMLTGDHAASAHIVADSVGIADVHADLLPEDKLRAVAVREQPVAQANRAEASGRGRGRAGTSERSRSGGRSLGFTASIRARLRGESTASPITMMVGDGVNDAPVLATADIGVAITDGTSTAASQSAQAVIMNDDIAAVPRAIAIARRTKQVMLQAVIIGLALAFLGMVAAAFNLIPVVVGAFLQEAIDVVSILWALTALLERDWVVER
ncbi:MULTISPECIES: HAD-IC family P-type ATPase [Bifidobacterium]|uniref:HAD-IC family P-type ATPase n=1 Tax=Bifidobacterium TaxID=1678 RepID=UPI0023574F0D|nr:HAD-IC family P-type ATPase [Bifidobacterium tibiigranuli]MCI1212249.1 HAD-IC family P-type ATPase [Bifidobacterium tibiigranuli]MCI1222080.1 HAD-IC family P-type ATPase [Bifidobacterium tibiigranuli]MCI1792239.1 HAD-IC family P-type ATPase [Bifidobacterium tibiigranuli]MCI1797487.1 HAD-IC family P-type ATPase [Bifidobacterium tibiigranuli]